MGGRGEGCRSRCGAVAGDLAAADHRSREDHLRRPELSFSAAEAGGAPPENPSVFLRLVNTPVAHNQPLVRPEISSDFDYEGELALVIGKPGRQAADEAG